MRELCTEDLERTTTNEETMSEEESKESTHDEETSNFPQEDQARGVNRQAFSSEYYRDDLLTNIEDQVETSKLVLQLVTDSRFNMTQINGQRKLGGPPPGWTGPAPGPGCEVFVGKIPRTLYEHEIYPIFRRMGEVYEIRLMMDFSGTNRGYCFVMFGKPEFAQRAIDELDNFEIRPGRRIGVVASINNCRLYVGQLPHDVKSETVIKKVYDITDDVGQVAVYRNANDQARYALISYKTHRGAAMARRRLVPDRASLFGGAEVSIDWAHPCMFPSNVVEETGICDDDGNIKITRLNVGSENKRCQNRRRARDDFLDHNIRAYIQSDRALEQASRNNKQQNQNFNNCLNSVAREINNFHLFDENCGDANSPNYFDQIARSNNSRASKNRCRSEISGKSIRDSNSSFDLNVCSGSSESSACSSSQSSVSTLNNFTNSKFQPGVQYSVDFNEEEIFTGQIKIGKEIRGRESCKSACAVEKIRENDSESLNLFDDYTFLQNSHDKENQDTGNDFSEVFGNVFGNVFTGTDQRKISGGDNYANLKIRKDFETKRGAKKTKGKNSGRNSVLANHENNRGYNFAQKSMKTIAKSSALNYENGETFAKTVGAPLKNLPSKYERKLSTVEITQNQHIHDQINYEDNCRKLSSSSASLSSAVPLYHRSQFRNGICALVSNKIVKNFRLHQEAENYLINLHHMENNRILDSCNVMNRDARKAWLLNAYELARGNNANNLNYRSRNTIINPNSRILGEYSGPVTSALAFVPQDNSPVMNLYPVQNCFQNKKFSLPKIMPKGIGRPILSRSRAGDEN